MESISNEICPRALFIEVNKSTGEVPDTSVFWTGTPYQIKQKIYETFGNHGEYLYIGNEYILIYDKRLQSNCIMKDHDLFILNGNVIIIKQSYEKMIGSDIRVINTLLRDYKGQ